MKRHKKIEYTDEPIGEVRIISDFLPAPENLVMKEDTEKITLSLTKTSVNFFKKVAQKNHTQYQRMIRKLLNEYVIRYQEIYK